MNVHVRGAFLPPKKGGAHAPESRSAERSNIVWPPLPAESVIFHDGGGEVRLDSASAAAASCR